MKKKFFFVRPNWDEYFMGIAHVVKNRSNCIAGQIGAIIAKERRIIATGYNGTSMGIKNCFEGGCDRCKRRKEGKLKSGQDLDACICLHAEQNAILQSAYHGISTKGAVLYTTETPCRQCSKMIVNSGIVRVVAHKNYADTIGRSLLKSAKIKLIVMKQE